MELLANLGDLIDKHEEIFNRIQLVFIGLIVVWFFTGYFRPIGWLVRALWLPCNAIAFGVWCVFASLGYIYFRYKNFFWVLGAFFGITTLIFSPEDIFIGVLFVFALWLGTVGRNRIKKLVTFYPKPLRTPAPSECKARSEQPADINAAPPHEQIHSTVKISASYSGGHHNEAKIIQNLPSNLQNLLTGKFGKGG